MGESTSSDNIFWISVRYLVQKYDVHVLRYSIYIYIYIYVHVITYRLGYSNSIIETINELVGDTSYDF